MGEIFIDHDALQLTIHSIFFFYGDEANDMLAQQIATDIQDQWNKLEKTVSIKRNIYKVQFHIEGYHAANLQPEDVWYNDDPKNNYFRIERFSNMDISFVDSIGSNTGYFKLDNILNNSTTAAHEYGHTLGLHHPRILDIRGSGAPGIMYPRGTICDPFYQYDPNAQPGPGKGGTLNPAFRKVLQSDVDNLCLHRLSFKNNKAVLGEFSSIYHEKH